MNAWALRKVDSTAARFSRRLGAGASLAFDAQGLAGELTLRPHAAGDALAHPINWFDSAIGVFGLSDASAMLSLMGELPVTLAGEAQSWYWQMLNQRFSPAIAELLSPVEPLSNVTALSDPASSAIALTCRVQLRLGEESLHGWLHADAEVLLRLLDGPRWQFHRQTLDEHWPVHQPVELGQLSLSLAQLASLQPGDVLLPSLCNFDSDGNGRLQLGGRQWAVQTDSHERQLYVRLSHEEDLEHGQ
ncbi:MULTISPECIES: type III secretion system protein [unclassified Pseudomonas]|uniref:type III secretion system protein n=1 Tax=unclassified Pseudomonas TaxID=196821 RepID=UPI0025D26A53|nr:MULTISPECIES: type III secretion system protein [unclassified Pseudomonas]